MTAFVIVIHCLVSLILIFVVLLQPGNKQGMGSAFGGGGGGNVFGGRGANTFLARITAGAAVVFMLTSFGLVWLSSEGTSVMATTTSDTPAAKTEAPAGDPPPAPSGEKAPEGDK